MLHAETIVAAPLDETFAFFADAANLERLTPPWLNFQIRTPLPLTMAEGVEIDYLIVLHGLPIPWRSRIDVWEPGVRFVDRQVLGPYRWWHHEHRFESAGRGTRVVDHVEFVPRLRWITGALVQRRRGAYLRVPAGGTAKAVRGLRHGGTAQPAASGNTPGPFGVLAQCP